MDVDNLLAALSTRQTIETGSPLFELLHSAAQEAIQITTELGSRYHDPEQVVELMSRLTGREVDPSFRLFPPFRTDFGKNIHLGRRVFINSGCVFQDQGGIWIGDDVLIGHNAVLATLNHDEDPDHRGDLRPAPIRVGDRVWLGANVTILPGVTIGPGAVVGAGSLVTRDIPAEMVAVGSPARVVRPVRRRDQP